jgi:L-seryl-tRNA(Ser) seleniumtransferase
LARALRVDKLTLAALEGTLRLYVTGREREIPTIKYLARAVEEVEELAKTLSEGLPFAHLVPSTSGIGGGAAAGYELPTVVVALQVSDPERVAEALRTGNPPIIPRIEDGRVLLDPRTMEEEEAALVRQRLLELCGG